METTRIRKIDLIRKKILHNSKKIIAEYGWNDNLFYQISKKSKYSISEINSIFPNGYAELIIMYLDEMNFRMTSESKKINLSKLRVHQRIRELIILRLKIMSKEKKLISKTLSSLFLPHNYKLASRRLYKAVDQMWFLAGDNSTDFNYYSKRSILSYIYVTILIHYINNDNIEQTISLLDKKLKNVSKIPQVKKKINQTISEIPKFLDLTKIFFSIKQ